MSELNVDTINEQTAANGVTIDGVLIKDGQVDGVDVSTLSVDSNDLVLIDTYSLTSSDSDVATITMDQVFSSAYDVYDIHFLNATSDTGTNRLHMTMRTGSSGSEADYTSANYVYQAMFHRTNVSDSSGDPSASGHEGFSDTAWKSGNNVYTAATSAGLNMNITISNAYLGNSGDTTNTRTSMRYFSEFYSTTEMQQRWGSGVIATSTSYGPFTGIKFSLSANNFNTADIRIYGYKNS